MVDQILRDAVIARVCANDEVQLTLSGVIDDVFSEKQEIPRYRVREAVLDLLYDQELVMKRAASFASRVSAVANQCCARDGRSFVSPVAPSPGNPSGQPYSLPS